MSLYQALFLDIDGTLLNSHHRIDEKTVAALKSCLASGKRIVLTSSRPVSGLEPILKRYSLDASIIALGGAVVLDEKKNLLLSQGMPGKIAKEVASFTKEANLPAACNIYTVKDWIVLDKQDPRVRNEAEIIESEPSKRSFSSLEDEELVCKILLICDKGTIDTVESKMKERFPQLLISRSSDILLEINPAGVDKGDAIRKYCQKQDIPLDWTLGFGDNFNDLPMLNTVGTAILMGNAPKEIQDMFLCVTADNDHDGIAKAIAEMHLL